MGYDIIKNLKVVKAEDNTYYAEVTCACSNVRSYSGERIFDKVTWYRALKLTKEEVETTLLLDYFYGNNKGGNNKYNAYIKANGNWCMGTGKISRRYQFYDKIRDRLWEKGEYDRIGKLGERARRETKRTIYADFLNFLNNRNAKTPNTVLEVFKDKESYGYITMTKGQRNLRVNLYKPYATIYSSREKINSIIAKANNMGYEVKEILV